MIPLEQKSSENLTKVHLSMLGDGKLTESIWPILLWEAANKVFTIQLMIEHSQWTQNQIMLFACCHKRIVNRV